MHLKGSRDPHPQPPTLTQATNTLAALKPQSRRYSALMRQWDRSDPAVANIFEPFQYLTRTEIQELVERARTLIKKIGANFQLDPKGRKEHEEHESLKRLLKSTQEDLTAVESWLNNLQQPQRPRFYSHPSVPDLYLSESGCPRPEYPFHPSDEVLQLRGENSEYRDENLALGEEKMALWEELDEKEAIIRSLRDRLAVLERELEYQDDTHLKGKRERGRETEDQNEGKDEVGPIREAKRRNL